MFGRKSRNGDGGQEDWAEALVLIGQRRRSLRRILKGNLPHTVAGFKFVEDQPASPDESPAVLEPAALELAAIDLFVEKVQLKLTQRAERHQRVGFIYSSLVFLVLAGAVITPKLSGPHEVVLSDPWADLVLVVLGNAAALGVFLGAAFFMASLARSHLHEATVLFNRRHMVRLGRLFLYLKFVGLGANKLRKAKAALSVEDIERAFGPMYEFSTAFKEIRPEILTQTLLGQLLRTVGGAAKSKVKGEVQ